MLEAIQCRRHARLFQDGSFLDRNVSMDQIFTLEKRFEYWHHPERHEWFNI